MKYIAISYRIQNVKKEIPNENKKGTMYNLHNVWYKYITRAGIYECMYILLHIISIPIVLSIHENTLVKDVLLLTGMNCSNKFYTIVNILSKLLAW